MNPIQLAVVFTSLSAALAPAEQRHSETVIFAETATEVSPSSVGAGDLWITLADLTRATKLQVKPEGVCSEKQCFPLPEGRKGEFLAERAGETRFNLSAFARLLGQPVAHDRKNGVWYFGPRPDEQNGYLASLVAPDFTLPDVTGKSHSLSDFRGKKVLLITWASW
jgi:AhpC/TSA family